MENEKKMMPTAMDVTSPYFLGSGDQPGNLISSLILNSDNYVSWSRAITLSLKAGRKFVFIAGKEEKPTDEKGLTDWETVNSMIVSWIMWTIEPKLAVSVPYHEEAKALWLYLEKRFSVSNRPRLVQLRESISEYKQGKDQSFEEYYGKLMALFDEYARLRPLHNCVCGKCSCDVAGKFAKDRENDMLHQFLIGVKIEKYGVVRSNLLSQDPIPNLERAYQAISQEERIRMMAKTKEIHGDISLYVVKGKNEHRLDKSKLACKHCRKNGHDESSCFKLHGVPEWWQEKFGKKNGAGPKGAGGAQSSASKEKGKELSLHAVREETVNKGVSSGGLFNTPTPLDNLSQEQREYIMNLINTEKSERMMGKKYHLSWIVDLDASNHFT